MTILRSEGSGETSTGFYSKTIDQSLRFEDGDDPYLTFTPSSATNQKTWTYSLWVKRTTLAARQCLLAAGTGGGLVMEFRFGLSDELEYLDSSSTYLFITSQKFRDPSAWYHLVLRVDTTQSSVNDRTRLYVNGEQVTSFSTDNRSNHAEDEDLAVNTNTAHYISRWVTGGENHDGYFAEINFLDGVSVDCNSFGEFKDGVWVPKQYSGSYGTNGWRLDFADSSDIGNNANTTDGTNDWTPNNLAATDVVPDSPTNNFATLNSLVVSGGSPTLSEGNLKLVGSGTDYDTSYATIAVTSGKWYAEFLYVSGDDRAMFGVVREDRLYYVNGSAYIGSIDDTYGIDFRARAYTGTSATSSSGSELFDATNFDTGDIGLLCFDVDNGKLWFGRRDVSGSTTIWYDSSGNNNGDPSAGSNPTYTFTATGSTWFIGCHDYNGTTLIANFGQDGSFAGSLTSQGASDAGGIGDFNYIESGFLALCTSNMPDITIGPGQDTQADDNFNTVLYTGNGGTNAITGVGFSPDWVWIKSRSNTTVHALHDVLRGTKLLQSNATDGEQDNANYLTAYGADGFTVGDSSNVNGSSRTYVAWNWKAGGTPTGDNSAGNGATPTAGSVKIDGSNFGSALAGSLAAKRLTANTTAGFSIVSWDASGVSSGTVAHGLTVAPDIIIAKPSDKDGTNWFVQVPDVLANTNMLNLETTGGSYNPGYAHFNDTVPTDEVFSFGGYLGGHADLGSDTEKIAYCFHSVEGYSKVGSYKGNGAADGTFIFTGFRPSFVFLKKSSGSGDNWSMYDNKRDTDNPVREYLIQNDTQAAGATDTVDFVSNGFKVRNAGAYINTNTATYIYLAFAEAPFKFANAR